MPIPTFEQLEKKRQGFPTLEELERRRAERLQPVDPNQEKENVQEALEIADKHNLPLDTALSARKTIKNIAPDVIQAGPIREDEYAERVPTLEERLVATQVIDTVADPQDVPLHNDYISKYGRIDNSEYENLRRNYKDFWDELSWQIGAGTTRLAAGGLSTLASVSESAIWDKDQIEDAAQFLYELGDRPELAIAKGAGWKGFVATAVGQALPYMGAAGLATATSGTSLGAFGVAFAAEGGDAYMTALKHGASEPEARTNMFIVGTINGALERMQIDKVWKFAKTGSAAKKAILRDATARTWKKILGSGKELSYEYLQLMITESTQESLQELTSITLESRQNPDVWNYATERILQAGAGGAVVSGLGGFGGRVSGLALSSKTDTINKKYNDKIKVAQERGDAEAVKSLRAMEQEELSKLEGVTDEIIQEVKEEKEKEAKKKPETKPAQKQAKPAEAKQPAAEKQPWEMTREEYIADRERVQGKPKTQYKGMQYEQWDFERKQNIQRAVEQNKPVPRSVLEEYKSESWAKEALAKGEREIENKEFQKLKRYFMESDKDNVLIHDIPTKAQQHLWKAGAKYGQMKWANWPDIKNDTQAKTDLAKIYDEMFAQPAPAAKAEKPKQPTIKKIQAQKQQERDILGGVDPLQRIHSSLREAKKVQPLTEAQKKETLRKRVGAAAGAMKSNVKKGVPTEEAIFKSTGLLKGELAEYDQVYESIEDALEPGQKEAAYQQIYNHPDLKYFEIVNTATSFKKLLAGTALTPGDVKNIERVFGKQFKEVTDERATVSDLYDRLVSLWKAGLLTGIKTSGLNILANVSHSMTETAKDIPAVLVDSAAATVTGKRTIGFTLRGAPTGTIEGFQRGWKYLRTGVDARNVGKKLDYKEVNFGNSKFAKALQAYEETIFHLLGAEDQPFYYGAKARSLYSQAIAKAKNKGLKGKERTAFIDNLVKNPTDNMLEWSVYDAEIAVFQNRTHLGDIAKSIQNVKGGEIIVPFGRTPAAVATQIINYSPVGIIKEVAHEISLGRFDQKKFSQAFGRSTIGTGALFIGTVLFKAGLITLDRPDNERERELWKVEGRSANSIKIGDKWRSIQTLGPVGNLLVIGGHFQKMLEQEGSPTKAIATAMAGGAKSFSEQTFVRGVNMAVDALTDPEKSFENWWSSMAGSLVPTIVADTARAMDDIERKAITPTEKIQKRIPVLREKLPPAIDVFGQDLPRYGGNVLESMADPTRPAKIRQDIVVDELRRLWDKKIKVSPTQLGDKAGYDVLTKEENTQLWRRSGELTYKLLSSLVTSKGYQGADDYQRGRQIETIVRKAKSAAKAEMVNIKIGQGKTIMELAESGLLNLESLEMLKYYREQE